MQVLRMTRARTTQYKQFAAAHRSTRGVDESASNSRLWSTPRRLADPARHCQANRRLDGDSYCATRPYPGTTRSCDAQRMSAGFTAVTTGYPAVVGQLFRQLQRGRPGG